MRQNLTGNTIYWVSPNGSDSNNGSQASPWQTLQHAFDFISSTIDFAGYNINVSCSDGTYAPFVASGVLTGARRIDSLTFTGNLAHPNQVVISNSSGPAVLVSDNADIKLDGIQLQGAGTSVANDLTVTEGRVALGTVVFASCPWAHMQAVGPRSRIALVSQYYYNFGTATFHILAEQGAFVSIAATLQTLSTGLGFGTLAYADDGAQIDGASFNYVGQSLTGRRYFSLNGATINTSGRGPYVFPGSLDGTNNYPGPNAGYYS